MEQQDDPNLAPKWPLYVRVLAVLHVLSYPIQIAAFLGFIGTAAFVYSTGRAVNGTVIVLMINGFAMVALCSAFRTWFVAWGRRRYPEGKTKAESGTGE